MLDRVWTTERAQQWLHELWRNPALLEAIHGRTGLGKVPWSALDAQAARWNDTQAQAIQAQAHQQGVVMPQVEAVQRARHRQAELQRRPALGPTMRRRS